MLSGGGGALEYFKQNKQRQRAGERFVMIIYSLYTVNLCIGIARKGCAAWVPALMLALAAAAILGGGPWS